LQCVQCQNIIPFDIATGKRMILADWAECPKCKFACSSRHMTHVLAVEKCCPMCNEEVHPDEVKRVTDPIGAIRKKAEAAAGL
jgi:WD repeat-containing protein 19